MKNALAPVATPRLIVKKSPSVAVGDSRPRRAAVAGKARPLPGGAERREWDGFARVRGREQTPERHADFVSLPRRRRLVEDDDRRGDQRVAELHVRWAVAVDPPERDAPGQVRPEGRPVVHVQELGGHQPDGEPPIGQPGVAQQEEMGIEAGQTADRHSEPVRDDRLQSLLVLAREMVVSDVGRVREDEIILPIGGETGEIAPDHPQLGPLPERRRGGGEGRVDLDATAIGDRRAGGEGLRRSRPNRTHPGPDRRIEEGHAVRPVQPVGGGISRDVEGQGRRGRELPQAIPLLEGLPAIETPLLDLAPRLDRVHGQGPSWSRSDVRCRHAQPMPAAAP